MSERSIEIMKVPFYQREALRFECAGCGACCTAGGGDYVYVTKHEIDKISVFLGISSDWFKRRYLGWLPGEGWVLAINDGETCLFLGEERRCTIYAVHPEQCSTCPYWPELVLHKRNWMQKSRCCEGMGRGKIVSKKMMAILLKQQAKYES